MKKTMTMKTDIHNENDMDKEKTFDKEDYDNEQGRIHGTRCA